MNIPTVRGSLTLLDRIFDAKGATEPLIPPTEGKPHWPHIGEKSNFFVDTAALGDAGISPRALHAYLCALRDDVTLDTHGIVICKDGKTLARIPFGMHDMTVPRYVYSASKTVTAMAVGVLLDRGLLSCDDKLVDLLPSRFNPITRHRLSALSVEDLLTMRSAVSFAEADAMTDDDWVKSYLSASLSGEIGKTFAYNSQNTYMLSVIVAEKTSMTLYDFVKETFFVPMGISHTFWEACPRGNTVGGWGLYITPEDLCKMGTVLIDGTYAGKRYLSEAFVKRMRSPIVHTTDTCGAYDYGYQMWVHPENGLALMNGMFGQNVFIDTKTGITLAVLSGNGELFQRSNTYPLTETFLASVGGKTAPDTTEQSDLSSLAASLCEHRPAPPKAPKKQGFFTSLLSRLLASMEEDETPAPDMRAALAAPFAGHTFTTENELAHSLGLLPLVLQAVRNHYTRGFVSLSVGKTRDGALPIVWTENDTSYTVSVGMDGVSRRTWVTFGKTPYLIDAKGIFTQNEDGEPTLSVTLVFAETPHTRRIKLFAHKNGTYTLCADEAPGEDLIVREAMAAKHKAQDKPIIGGVLSKIDDDYLVYRVQRTFAPRIGMERE